MSTNFRERFGADTRDCEPWPYSRGVYLRRALWWLVHATIWRLCWKRLPSLRCGLLRLFGARIASTCHIAGSAWIEMPWNFEMGSFGALGAGARIYNLAPIRLGAHVVISQDAHLCGGTHDYEDPTYPLLFREIVVGDYVWVAAEAFVLPGVTLGEGAVVGARAVVARDVEPWKVVAGNPARVVGERHFREQVQVTSLAKAPASSDEPPLSAAG